MLAHSILLLSLWSYAFQTATYLINRLPTLVLHSKSPYQVLYDKLPDYSLLRCFGCACFPFLRPYNSHKLMFRSTECLFLGYSTNHKGYLCLDPISGRLYVSRHVVFNENYFPCSKADFKFGKLKYSPPDLSFFNSAHFSILPSVPLSPSVSSQSLSHPSGFPPPSVTAAHHPSSPFFQSSASASSPMPSDVSLTPSLTLSCSPSVYSSSSSDVSPIVPPSATPSSAPSSTAIPPSNANVHLMVTPSKASITKPKCWLSSSSIPSEPSSFREAVKIVEWQDAMAKEFDALVKNKTWTLIPPSSAYPY